MISHVVVVRSIHYTIRYVFLCIIYLSCIIIQWQRSRAGKSRNCKSVHNCVFHFSRLWLSGQQLMPWVTVVNECWRNNLELTSVKCPCMLVANNCRLGFSAVFLALRRFGCSRPILFASLLIIAWTSGSELLSRPPLSSLSGFHFCDAAIALLQRLTVRNWCSRQKVFKTHGPV